MHRVTRPGVRHLEPQLRGATAPSFGKLECSEHRPRPGAVLEAQEGWSLQLGVK